MIVLCERGFRGCKINNLIAHYTVLDAYRPITCKILNAISPESQKEVKCF